MSTIALFFKSHVDTYTKKDGTVVQAHDDKRQAARPFKKGDRVRIKPEHQDDGDDKFTWHAVDDEEKGRVTVSPTDHPMKVKPTYVMHTHQIEHHGDDKPAVKDWREEENWHSRQMAKMKTHSEAELRYIIKDATEAAEIGEKSGRDSKKTGQYRDEAHYAAMELKKRQDAVKDKSGRAQPAP